MARAYHPPTDRRGDNEAAADLRLARLAAMPLRSVQRLSPPLRDELLEHHASEQAARRSAERQALADGLADLNVDATRDEHRRG